MSNVKESKRECPVCNGRIVEIIKHVDMIVPEDYIITSKYDLVVCAECGCVFSDVIEIDKYSEYYSQYSNNTSIVFPDQNNYEFLKNTRYNQTVEFLKKFEVAKDSEILDIGCSYGGVLRILKSLGYNNIHGLDPDVSCVDLLNSDGIQCYMGSIVEEMPQFLRKFDYITLGHILEHLFSPIEAVENIKKWLRPNGLLIIEVPDVERYGQYSVFPGFFLDNEHINHFSIDSLKNLMSRCGFELDLYRQDTIFALISEFPVLYAAFGVKEGLLEHNDIFARADNDYFSMKASLDDETVNNTEITDKIKKLISTGAEIAVWGAGQYLWRLLSFAGLNKCNIKYIIDKSVNKQGVRLFDRTVTSPDILADFTGTIVISTRTNAGSILADIKVMGLLNDLVLL